LNKRRRKRNLGKKVKTKKKKPGKRVERTVISGNRNAGTKAKSKNRNT